MVLVWWLMSVLPFWVSALKWRDYQYENPRAGVTDQFIALRTTVRGLACPLQVVRWQKGHPSAHIFLVAPEAGQAAIVYWEERLDELLRIYGRDFCLYAVDLRGTGESSPLRDISLTVNDSWGSENDETHDYYAGVPSASEAEPESPDGELGLREVTTLGQAEDLLEVMRMIREEPGFAGNFYLHARAFGCLIAARVIEASDANTLLSGVLLESPLPVAYGPSPGPQDTDLIAACTDEPDCKKALGMDMAQVRTAVTSLASRHFNECSRLLHETLERTAATYSKLGQNSSDWLRLLELFHGISRLPGPGAAILLPLVQSTYVCTDPSKYGQQVLPDLLRAVIEHPREGNFELFDIRGQTRGVNSFVNAWLMLRAWFAAGTSLGRHQNACKETLFRGLTSPCVLYRYYRRYLRTFGGFFRRGDDDALPVPYKIKGENTKLIFVAGALDIHSPAAGVRDWHAKSTSDRGTSIHVFTNQAGMPLQGTSACIARVGDELLRDGSSEAVESCLKQPEANVVDWTFATFKEMSVRDWWSPARTPQVGITTEPAADEHNDKTAADKRTTDPKVKYLLIAAIIVGIVVLVVLLIDLVIRFKGRTFVNKELG